MAVLSATEKFLSPKSAFPTEEAEDVERDEEGNIIEEILMDEPPVSAQSGAEARHQRRRPGSMWSPTRQLREPAVPDDRTRAPQEFLHEETTMTPEEELPMASWSENEIPEAVREEILEKVPARVRRQVRRTHRGLGHPGRETMLRMMRLGGASPAALQYARVWQCPVCAQVAPPPKMMQASPTTGPY